MYTERQDDRFGGRVIKETKGKGGYLEKYPFFDWEPVKLFEKWCNMLMFAFAKKRKKKKKKDFGCMILNFFEGGTFDQK